MNVVIHNRTYSAALRLMPTVNSTAQPATVPVRLHLKEVRGRLGTHQYTRIVYYTVLVSLQFPSSSLPKPVHIEISARKKFTSRYIDGRRFWFESVVGIDGSHVIDCAIDPALQHPENNIGAIHSAYSFLTDAAQGQWSLINEVHRQLELYEPSFQELFRT